jgi:hypothetical protein
MTFKEQATADIATFLNVDEFASIAEINGEQVACVLEGNDDTQASEPGVINVDTLLHARASDFHGHLPTVGSRITVDDRPGDVTGVVEEQGFVHIRLRWLDS